ncbi:MAG: hypothetical protein ACF8PG_13405, partial [Maioricimonas sp. JB045]
KVPVTVQIGSEKQTHRIDMRQEPPVENGWISLGTYDLRKSDRVSVTVSTEDAGGNAHADAVQLLPVK